MKKKLVFLLFVMNTLKFVAQGQSFYHSVDPFPEKSKTREEIQQNDSDEIKGCGLFEYDIQKNDKAILSFSIAGISLGHKLENFLMRKDISYYYSASSSDNENNLKVYMSEKIPNTSGVVFNFLDDELYFIRIMYDPELTKNKGGISNIVEDLVNKYGQKFTQDADFLLHTDFPRVKRKLRVIGIPETPYTGEFNIVIDFINTEKEEELNMRKKAKIDLGF